MTVVPNLMRSRDRLALFVSLAIFGGIAFIVAGVGSILGDQAVDFQNMMAWGFAVVFCAAIWVFNIGKQISSGTRLFVSLCAFLLYLYSLLLLFWFGGWLLFNAETFIVKALSIVSMLASFMYIRLVWKTSELALNLQRHLSEMGIEDKP